MIQNNLPISRSGTLMTSAESVLPWKVTRWRTPGIRTWTSLGAIILFFCLDGFQDRSLSLLKAFSWAELWAGDHTCVWKLAPGQPLTRLPDSCYGQPFCMRTRQPRALKRMRFLYGQREPGRTATRLWLRLCHRRERESHRACVTRSSSSRWFNVPWFQRSNLQVVLSEAASRGLCWAWLGVMGLFPAMGPGKNYVPPESQQTVSYSACHPSRKGQILWCFRTACDIRRYYQELGNLGFKADPTGFSWSLFNADSALQWTEALWEIQGTGYFVVKVLMWKGKPQTWRNSRVAQSRKAWSANGLVPDLSNGHRHFGLLFAFLIWHLFPSS